MEPDRGTHRPVSRSDWRHASAWLDEHRPIAGLLALLAVACVVTLAVSSAPYAKKLMGMPLFAGIGAYAAWKALPKNRL